MPYPKFTLTNRAASYEHWYQWRAVQLSVPFVCLLIGVALVNGCAVSDDQRNDRSEERRRDTASSAVAAVWPDANVPFADTVVTHVPPCAPAATITPDSLGPMRPGATLHSVLARCPTAKPFWLWEEGSLQAALVINIGGAAVQVLLDDTLSSSVVERIVSADSLAKTPFGIGPGKSVADLERAYGRMSFGVAECAIYAYASAIRGLSWKLLFPEGWTCDQLGLLERGDLRPPSDTRISTVIVFRR